MKTVFAVGFIISVISLIYLLVFQPFSKSDHVIFAKEKAKNWALSYMKICQENESDNCFHVVINCGEPPSYSRTISNCDVYVKETGQEYGVACPVENNGWDCTRRF